MSLLKPLRSPVSMPTIAVPLTGIFIHSLNQILKGCQREQFLSRSGHLHVICISSNFSGLSQNGPTDTVNALSLEPYLGLKIVLYVDEEAEDTEAREGADSGDSLLCPSPCRLFPGKGSRWV